ncbi:flagellar hook-basal body complex protein FliE [Cellulosilyticum sp. I15G10I2]|uniref:flagellar hook-basal body complex protein FliE n=1 Tax=Cellulosilyticum sp. I15G10I2 TaxID=1892843 RepID=UPI00085BAF00|nr:flagellar hook-basal body complex protein FliE [Cellulosilyticum sp. I15G10I2]
MIQAIQQLQGASLGVNKLSSNTNLTSDTSFVDSFEAAKKLLQETNEAEKIASEYTYDFITGKNDNIHSLMIAQEKSSILLQFTMQVRNQVIDAYKEIMRLPI